MNNNNNNALGLISHLEQEIEWVEQLNNLLTQEKEFLGNNQFDQLESLAVNKQNLSTKLEESANERVQLMSHESKPISLNEYLKDCSSHQANQIKQLNESLIQKLTLCRELNTVNGQVISYNINSRQQIVNDLSGTKADAVSIYTSNGNIHTGSGDNTHHQEA